MSVFDMQDVQVSPSTNMTTSFAPTSSLARAISNSSPGIHKA
jgi:hypothetical protein